MALQGNKQRIRISIIIPVLNEEKLLPATLSCFPPSLCEKYGIEIIVSDGGSIDGTLAVAVERADTVVYCDQGRRQTIAEGRNAGAKRAQGSILIFINGDTVIVDPESFFQTVVQLFEGENKQYAALVCPVYVHPNERTMGDALFHGFFNNYIRFFVNMLGIGMGRGECQIVDADVFRQLGGYKEEVAAGEDFDLIRRIAKKHPVRFHPELVVYESPRRFRRYGYWHMMFSWSINALSVILFGKSLSKEWEAVR